MKKKEKKKKTKFSYNAIKATTYKQTKIYKRTRCRTKHKSIHGLLQGNNFSMFSPLFFVFFCCWRINKDRWVLVSIIFRIIQEKKSDFFLYINVNCFANIWWWCAFVVILWKIFSFLFCFNVHFCGNTV